MTNLHDILEVYGIFGGPFPRRKTVSNRVKGTRLLEDRSE